MMQIFDCEQNSPEWYAARLGIPTASEFGTVMAKGRGGGESKTRRTYMLKLLGERFTGEPADSYSNHHMERGQEMEAEAISLYEFQQGIETASVGFIRNGETGASPDRLVEADGLLEAKTKLPHLQLECLDKAVLPPEHKPQIQGQLWVAEREWCDFISYWPRLPLFCIRAHRDEEYIKTLESAVNQFLEELHELEHSIRTKYGIPEAA